MASNDRGPHSERMGKYKRVFRQTALPPNLYQNASENYGYIDFEKEKWVDCATAVGFTKEKKVVLTKEDRALIEETTKEYIAEKKQEEVDEKKAYIRSKLREKDAVMGQMDKGEKRLEEIIDELTGEK